MAEINQQGFMKLLFLLCLLPYSAYCGSLQSIALSNCPGTTGKCLKAVRVAVQKTKGMPLKGDTISAKNWGYFLETKYRAKKLAIKDPKKAPLEAIIIYAGNRRSRHGHIEIKTSKGFVSDHISKFRYAGAVLGIYAL